MLAKTFLDMGSGLKFNNIHVFNCFSLSEYSLIYPIFQIMGVTNPAGEEKLIAAAFTSACGKTNMAMMAPKLPGWKV